MREEYDFANAKKNPFADKVTKPLLSTKVTPGAFFTGMVTDEYAEGHPLLQKGDYVTGKGLNIGVDPPYIVCDGDEKVEVYPETICLRSQSPKAESSDVVQREYDVQVDSRGRITLKNDGFGYYHVLENSMQHFCKLSFKLTIGLPRGSEPWYNVIIEDLPVSSSGLV